MKLKYYLPLLLLGTVLLTSAFTGCKKKDMSLKLNEPRNIRGVISYRRSFGDLNEKHLNIAQAIGIRPLQTRKSAESQAAKLQHITSNPLYSVDSLTHSIPYLIPGAAALLDTIGQNFLDSLTAKGLNPNKIIVTSVLRTQEDVKRLRRRNYNASANSAHAYGTTFDVLTAKGLNPNKIIVTSVLRTQEDVKRLRRRNYNASANSAHAYGTTFDVSWKRFEKVEDEDGRPLQDVSADTLKLVLSEVLRDVKKANAYGTTFDVSWKRFEKVEDEDGRPLQDVSADTLKLVLSEVLRDVKKANLCYIKYELKQGCFHITSRR